MQHHRTTIVKGCSARKRLQRAAEAGRDKLGASPLAAHLCDALVAAVDALDVFQRLAGAQLPDQRHSELAHTIFAGWLCQTGQLHTRSRARNVGTAMQAACMPPRPAAAGAAAARSGGGKSKPLEPAGRALFARCRLIGAHWAQRRLEPDLQGGLA